MNTISYNGTQIPVEGTNAEIVITSKIFQDWVATISPEVFDLVRIEIQSCDFLPHNGRILFVKLKAFCRNQSGSLFPCIVVLRGDAVVVLTVLTWQDKKYVLLVEQPRMSTGKKVFELLAGMTDGHTNPKEVALRELEEESQLVSILGLTQADVISLGTKPMTASPGLLDESLFVFCVEAVIPNQETFDKLQGLLCGLAEENEEITVHLVLYDEVASYSQDSKTLGALYLYEHRIKAAS